jgi:acetyl esterase/lipase
VTETPGDPRAILDRPARRPDNVLRYAAHEDGVIDMYGSGEAAGALVVLLHGGFWQQEYDRMHLRPLATALAQKGLLVAIPEFRRVREPGSAWPAIFDDVASACQFVAGLGGTAPRLPWPPLPASSTQAGASSSERYRNTSYLAPSGAPPA